MLSLRNTDSRLPGIVRHFLRFFMEYDCDNNLLSNQLFYTKQQIIKNESFYSELSFVHTYILFIN